MEAWHITVVLFCLLVFFILDLIRREKLSFKYAFGWLCGCVLGITFAVFQNVLQKTSSALGFVLMSNFVFFVCVFAAVFLGLLLTVFLYQQQRRGDIMAQRIALLQEELDALKSKMDTAERTGA